MALKYFYRSLEVYEALNNKVECASTIANIGEVGSTLLGSVLFELVLSVVGLQPTNNRNSKC